MSLEEQRVEVVSYWWSMAEESLNSGQREIDAKAYVFAINRLYYAAFYGVSAALFEREKAFKKHTGVRAAFHREFIKTGMIPVVWGKFYDQLFEDRQEGDYIALMTFDRDYVAPRLDQCRRFLDALRPFVSSIS
jgi:uncharacterized protein